MFIIFFLGALILPGILTLKLIEAEVNNKSDKNETMVAVICGNQIKELKSKAEVGKNPVWKEAMEFKITTESVIMFVVYTQEKNVVNTLGIAGHSLYQVSHGKGVAENHSLTLYQKDLDIGCLEVNLNFKTN